MEQIISRKKTSNLFVDLTIEEGPGKFVAIVCAKDSLKEKEDLEQSIESLRWARRRIDDLIKTHKEELEDIALGLKS